MTLSCKVLRAVYKFLSFKFNDLTSFLINDLTSFLTNDFPSFLGQRFDEFLINYFAKSFNITSAHSASLCPEKLFGIHIFRGQVLSFSTTTIWQVFYINDLTRFVINDFTSFWSVCAQCKFVSWKIVSFWVFEQQRFHKFFTSTI